MYVISMDSLRNGNPDYLAEKDFCNMSKNELEETMMQTVLTNPRRCNAAQKEYDRRIKLQHTA